MAAMAGAEQLPEWTLSSTAGRANISGVIFLEYGIRNILRTPKIYR